MSIWICSREPAGWKVSLSHWELCQFSFHYSTWGLNPDYHNKLYFYRYVQTEAAFQGIRLNFTWPPVFFGNTALPQLPPTSPHFFWGRGFAYGTCCSLNIISLLILYIVLPKLGRLIPFAFLEGFNAAVIVQSTGYSVTLFTLITLVSIWTCQKVHVKDYFIRL